MTQTRRNFLKTAAVTAIGAGITASPLNVFAQNNRTVISLSKKMKLTFKPYDLQLRHVFTLANSSRKTTPVVLTEIEYDGIVGYGEASLPPIWAKRRLR